MTFVHPSPSMGTASSLGKEALLTTKCVCLLQMQQWWVGVCGDVHHQQPRLWRTGMRGWDGAWGREGLAIDPHRIGLRVDNRSLISHNELHRRRRGNAFGDGSKMVEQNFSLNKRRMMTSPDPRLRRFHNDRVHCSGSWVTCVQSELWGFCPLSPLLGKGRRGCSIDLPPSCI